MDGQVSIASEKLKQSNPAINPTKNAQRFRSVEINQTFLAGYRQSEPRGKILVISP